MGRHRKFDASFKAKVAIAALQEKETLNSLATKYGLSPTVIQQWCKALEQQAGKVFATPQENKRELKQLKAQNERLLHKVGQLTIDCDFFCTSLRGCRPQSEIADLEQHRPAGMSSYWRIIISVFRWMAGDVAKIIYG